MKEFTTPLMAEAKTTVDESNFASTVKSGSLEVFATPMMLALMEEATCKACEPLLDEGETTVGIKVEVSHDSASRVGRTIIAEAILKEVDGRKLSFMVKATEDSGTCIGRGKIERFVVDADRFMKRVNG